MYAVFRFDGHTVRLTEAQFKQAVADGRLCRCNRCLACRAAEYQREAQEASHDA